MLFPEHPLVPEGTFWQILCLVHHVGSHVGLLSAGSKGKPIQSNSEMEVGKKITLPDFKLLFSIQMCPNSSQSKLTKTDVRTTSLPSSSVASPSLTDCCFANSTPQPLQRVSALYLFRSSPYFTAPFLPSSCDPQELEVGQGAANPLVF